MNIVKLSVFIVFIFLVVSIHSQTVNDKTKTILTQDYHSLYHQRDSINSKLTKDFKKDSLPKCVKVVTIQQSAAIINKSPLLKESMIKPKQQ